MTLKPSDHKLFKIFNIFPWNLMTQNVFVSSSLVSLFFFKKLMPLHINLWLENENIKKDIARCCGPQSVKIFSSWIIFTCLSLSHDPQKSCVLFYMLWKSSNMRKAINNDSDVNEVVVEPKFASKSWSRWAGENAKKLIKACWLWRIINLSIRLLLFYWF